MSGYYYDLPPTKYPMSSIVKRNICQLILYLIFLVFLMWFICIIMIQTLQLSQRYDLFQQLRALDFENMPESLELYTTKLLASKINPIIDITKYYEPMEQVQNFIDLYNIFFSHHLIQEEMSIQICGHHPQTCPSNTKCLHPLLLGDKPSKNSQDIVMKIIQIPIIKMLFYDSSTQKLRPYQDLFYIGDDYALELFNDFLDHIRKKTSHILSFNGFFSFVHYY